MSAINVSVFDNVIRRIENDDIPLNQGESIFYVDDKSKKIVKKSWTSKLLGKKNKIFIVGASGAARHTAEGVSREFEVRDIDSERSIAISFRYRVYCTSGNESTLVNCIAGFNTPEQAFGDLLDIAVQKAMEDIGEATFMDNYESEKEQLTKRVADYVKGESGLVAKLTLKLKYEDQLSLIKTNKTLAVRVTDQPEEYNVKLSFELGVLPHQKVKAVIAYPFMNTIENKVLAAAKAFFLKHTNYNDFYGGFKDRAKQSLLEEAINTTIAKQGRVLTLLVVKPAIGADQVAETITLELEVNHTPHLSHSEIIIKNNLQLILTDPSTLKSSGHDNVRNWAEKRLKAVLEEEIFEKNYMDFLLQFGVVEESIKKRMKAELETIGYDLKHLVSRPTMPEEEYLKPKAYTYCYKDLPTKSARIFVNFDVSVTYHFERFEDKIETMFNKNQSVTGLIEQAIRTYLETTLNAEDPETIYMKFNYDPEREEALERTLTDGIQRILIDDFGAEPTGRPVVKPQHTKIGEFVEGLLDQTVDFELALEPLGGSQLFEFRGDITTIGVSPAGWDRISKMNFSLKDIFDFYKRSLKSELEAFDADDILAYDSGDHRQSLEQLANHNPVALVESTYGIVIKISNFSRSRSELEKEENKLINAQDKSDIALALEEIESNKDKRLHKNEIVESIRTDKLARLKEAQNKRRELEFYDEETSEGWEGDARDKAEQLIESVEKDGNNNQAGQDMISDIRERRKKKTKNKSGVPKQLELRNKGHLEDRSNSAGEEHE